jgi:thymidylate kinase
MIIALEGIDASGKQTQAKEVAKACINLGIFEDVAHHDFPHYKTHAGGLVGRLLRGETLVLTQEEAFAGMSLEEQRKAWSYDKAMVIQSVMFADRLEWQHLLNDYMLDDKKLLILDRYVMSGMAYGFADGLPMAWLETVQSSLIDADLHFLIDITVDESKRRRPNRQDYYEKNFAKLECIAEVYRELFHDGDEDGLITVNGMQAPEMVTALIVNRVKAHQEHLAGLNSTINAMVKSCRESTH